MAVTSLLTAAPPAVNKYGIMFAGVLGMIALIMASTMINVAVPQIMGAYGLGQDQAHWMSSGFLAAMTVSMLANAAVVTRIGPRPRFDGHRDFRDRLSRRAKRAELRGGGRCPFHPRLLRRHYPPLVMGTLFLVFEPHERARRWAWSAWASSWARRWVRFWAAGSSMRSAGGSVLSAPCRSP